LTEEDPECAHSSPHGRPFPVALDPFQATRYEIAAFGRDAFAENIRYLGAKKVAAEGGLKIFVLEMSPADQRVA
jgi:hypothetical protein